MPESLPYGLLRTIVYARMPIPIIANHNNAMSELPGLIDTKQLLLFEEIYRCQSVSRAAESLGLSQPTVSIWLKELRQHFDDTLFVRTAQGMLPTPRADALIGLVRQAMANLRSLNEQVSVFEPASSERAFRIAMTDASHISILPSILSCLRHEAPSTRVDVVPIGKDIGRHLEMAEVDLAIGYAPELGAGIYQQLLYAEDFICLVSAQHPRVREQLSLNDFLRESHIAISQPGSITSELQRALADQGVRRRVALNVHSFLGLNALVSASDLLAIVPRQIGQVLAQAGMTTVFECPVALPGMPVRQYWHVRFHEEAGSRWLRRRVAQLFCG